MFHKKFGKWSAKGGKVKETAYTGYIYIYILVPESKEMLFMKEILIYTLNIYYINYIYIYTHTL